MKNLFFLMSLTILISCSSDDSSDAEPIESKNELTTSYKGYYEEHFDLPIAISSFNNIKITPIIEQTSATEELNLLQIFANNSNDNDNYISFKVLTEGTGNNILFPDSFIFKSHGATYHASDLDFKVQVNNGSEFHANFSGELDHWYNGEQRYVYLNIYSGSIIAHY